MTWDPHGGREEWARLAEPTRPPDILVVPGYHCQGQFGFPQEIKDFHRVIHKEMVLFTPEQRRAYMKRRRVKQKAKGVCLNCGKRPASVGRTCCNECLMIKSLNTKTQYYNGDKSWFQTQLSRQGNLCAICKTPMKVVQIDHDHQTERVRGLLCMQCNVGLGLFKDDIARLQSAINYLEVANESPTSWTYSQVGRPFPSYG
jgi:hypothetical protein